MRNLLLAVVFCLLASATVSADPFVILPNGELAFTTSFTTQGAFFCTFCTGSGTNSIVLGSGADTLTLTFTGIGTTLLIGNEAIPTVMGHIQATTTGAGFIRPPGLNPGIPGATFLIFVTQSSPTSGTASVNFISSGGLFFITSGSDWLQFPTGPNPPPFTYTNIVYSFVPIDIPPNGVADVTANIGAVPEPTSLLLLGSGVGMMLTLLKKRVSRTRSTN